MANTEVWYPENAQVYIYEHVEKEVAGSDIDGTNLDFTLVNAPSPILGSYFDTNGSAQSQYVDANGSLARRDFLVFKRKNGADTEWDTASDGSVTIQSVDGDGSAITGGSMIAFETAPTTTQADNIIVTYAHDKSEKSDEVLSVGESGGERPVEFIQVYNGKQIKVNRTQQSFSVDIETLKSDLSFAEFVNGAQVTENVSGSGSVYTVTGASDRTSKALVVDGDDPDTDNRMILLYWNVSGTSISRDGPAAENYTETTTFQTKAEDTTQIYWSL